MHPYQILLVEDNPGDVELIGEILAECAPQCHIHIVEDGEEALDFVYRRGAFTQALRPDLILLDLNLPRKDGKEVLGQVKQDKNLHHIPVVVMTSSEANSDITACYGLYANCYLLKPADLEGFTNMVKSVIHFWLEQAILPPRSKP